MALVVEKGSRLPGVPQAIELCRAHGLRLALASSSQYRLIEVVLDHIGLSSTFEMVYSAEDEPYGKPHPGVFLTTADRLGVGPRRCLVWEDAPAGVLAAKAARMACVAVPEPAERGHSTFAIADAVLGSLEEADEALWARLAAGGSRRAETPGIT
jgi:sugar-phosphatase